MWGQLSGTVTMSSGNSDSGRTIVILDLATPLPLCCQVELFEADGSIGGAAGIISSHVILSMKLLISFA